MKFKSALRDIAELTCYGLPVGMIVFILIFYSMIMSVFLLAGMPTDFVMFMVAGIALVNEITIIYSRFLSPTRIQAFSNFFQMKWAFRIGMKEGRYWSVLAMEYFAKDGATQVEREIIACLMRDRITKKIKKADVWTANSVSRMLKTLEAAAPAWEADFLVKVARSKTHVMTRGAAIRRMVELRRAGSLGLLMTLVDDPQVAADVANAITSIGPAAATPVVIARLKRMLAELQSGGGWAPSAAARALIAIGQANDPDLVVHIDKLDVWTRFVVRVKHAGLSASALTGLLFKAGVVGEDRRPAIKGSMLAKMEKALGSGEGFDAIINFLRRVRSVYGFDTEWDPEPEYKELLKQLSRVSSPRLPISNIAVRQGGEVSCQIGGHSAWFHPKAMGDWTDLEAVLVGLNTALAEAGRSERFANLQSGGQDAYVIVGTVDGLAELIETLGFPLDETGITPVAIGNAAEEHAAAQIAGRL